MVDAQADRRTDFDPAMTYRSRLAVALCLLLTGLLVSLAPRGNSVAASSNIAEDTFMRSNTTTGWGTTTNSDGLPAYSWLGDLGTTSFATISSDSGEIGFSGTDGHKVAGYVDAPIQVGGDVLAEFSFSEVGSEQCGVTLQVHGKGQWYQADLNTSLKELQIIRRYGYTMYPEATIPFAATANTDYWIRLDAQSSGGSEVLGARVWQAGSAEPNTWQVAWTDSRPLPAGYPGAMGDWFSAAKHGEIESFHAWSYANPGPAEPPSPQNSLTISSAAATTFDVAQASTFEVTTTGLPAPSLEESGALPGGITFNDNGNGTAVLAGTPTNGTQGSWPLIITATNTSGSVSQSFGLTVVGTPPAFTSAATGSAKVGEPFSFKVTASGVPAPALSATSGTLPPGINFTDDGAGNGTLSGTPQASGTYTIMLTGQNGVTPSAVQDFALSIGGSGPGTSPSFTADNPPALAFVGVAYRYTFVADGGPSLSYSTQSGTLPPGLSLDPTSGILSGDPTSDGTYSFVVSASNGIGSPATSPSLAIIVIGG